jgi:protein O-mannosyl-transferase
MAKKQQNQAAAKPIKKNASNEAPKTASMLWLAPVLLAFVVFLTGVGNAMTGIDDHTATTDNPVVNNFNLVALFSNFNLGMYAPMTWLFYAFGYKIGAKSPVPYHFFSLLVHCYCVYLVFRFVARLSKDERVALGVALVFAIHPLQVESVSWIAGFSTPLYSMFYLLALLRYMDYRDSTNGERQLTRYALALLFFLLACLSKSAAVTLPLSLIAVDLWRDRERLREQMTRLAVGYAPFFLIALGFGMLTVYSRQHSGMYISADGNHFDTLDRVQILGYTPVFYWSKFLLPLKLNIYYSFNKVDGAFPLYYWAALGIFLALAYAAWHYRKTASWLWWGLLFFFANISVMLPFRSLGTFELIADHYNYLAIIGLAFVAVSFWYALRQRFQAYDTAIKYGGYAWLTLMGVLCLLQIRIWKDTETVITNAIDNGFYQKGMMYFGRGIEYGDQGKSQLAIQDFSRAIELDSVMLGAYKFRGSLYAQGGQLALAQKDLEKYLTFDSKDVVVWFNLAMLYMRTQQNEKSLNAFNQCLAIKPNVSSTYERRAELFRQMGDTERMNADLQQAAALKSGKR